MTINNNRPGGTAGYITPTGNEILTNKDIDGGAASNTSRITLPKASSTTLAGLTRKEATLVYDTSLGKFLQDNGASLTALGSGSGAGELNAILNSSASDALTGWTDGTSHTTTRITTGSPLDPVVTTALNTSATTTAAESSTSGAKYSIATMPASLTNKKLKVEFYVTVEASQTWAVSVYQGTTRLSLSTDSSGATLLPAGTTGKFTAYFDTTSATAYSVNLTRTAGAGTSVLKYTNVIVGPGIQPQGAVVGPWINFTPSWNNFTSDGVNRKASYQRVGSTMHIKLEDRTNTPVSGNINLTIPGGLTADFTAVLGGSVETQGTLTAYDASATALFTGIPSLDNTIPTLIVMTADSGSLTRWNASTPFTWASADRISLDVTLPIAEWAGSGTLNTGANDVEYAYNTGTNTTGNDTTSFGYGPSGGQFRAQTASLKRRVQWLTPIQKDEEISIEFFEADQHWTPLEYTQYVSANVTQGTTRFGMYLEGVSTTQTDVVFGTKRLSNNTAYDNDATASNWSAIANTDSFKWRAVKRKKGVAVGFGLATATQSGLVPTYETGSFAATGGLTGTFSYVLVGKLVTIGWPNLTHASSATPSTVAGCIPSHIRPVGFTNNCYLANTAVVRRLEAASDGSLGFQFTDYAGSPSAQTATAQGSITYIIA